MMTGEEDVDIAVEEDGTIIHYSEAPAEEGETIREEIAADYTRSLIERSPFASEEWTENNYNPREW